MARTVLLVWWRAGGMTVLSGPAAVGKNSLNLALTLLRGGTYLADAALQHRHRQSSQECAFFTYEDLAMSSFPATASFPFMNPADPRTEAYFGWASLSLKTLFLAYQ